MEALLVPPAGRDYELQIAPPSKALDRIAAKKKPGRQSSRLVTAAYRRFLHAFYETHEPTRPTFLKCSIPYLVRNTSPQAAAVLAAVWFRKHGRGSYNAFMREAKGAIRDCGRPLGRLQGKFRTLRQVDTLHIAAHLQELNKGPFPLPTRELQMRLLLPTETTAWRILQRLVALGWLEVVDTGISRPKAAETGETARCAKFQFAPRS
jgi:hypothetical protein